MDELLTHLSPCAPPQSKGGANELITRAIIQCANNKRSQSQAEIDLLHCVKHSRVVKCANDKPTTFETMSISKAAIGLAFLLENVDVEQFLLPDSNITLKMALCHQTGVEDDISFDFDTFMDTVKGKDAYAYAVKTFLEKKKQSKPHFEYCNIVWHILVYRFQQITGKQVDKVIGAKLKDGYRWKKDGKGFPYGPNGMQLSLDSAVQFALLAAKQLKNITPPYPRVKAQYWKGTVPEVNVHCYFGWWIAIKDDKPVVAYAVGFNTQFICIDLTANAMPCEIQFRGPKFWEPPSEYEEMFVKRYIYKVLVNM